MVDIRFGEIMSPPRTSHPITFRLRKEQHCYECKGELCGGSLQLFVLLHFHLFSLQPHWSVSSKLGCYFVFWDELTYPLHPRTSSPSNGLRSGLRSVPITNPVTKYQALLYVVFTKFLASVKFEWLYFQLHWENLTLFQFNGLKRWGSPVFLGY